MSITEQRQQLILDELQRESRVSVKGIAARLDISTETVRRDLRELEMNGHARRVYGGAVIDRKGGDQPLDERLRVGAREKAKIAAAALPLLKDGMTIFIDAGSTTLSLARQLFGRRLCIHTNSISIAALLADDSQSEVVVLGGALKPDYKAVFGHLTLAGLREHVYDIAIMGIVTVHLEHGFMDLGHEEAVLRRVALEQTRHSVVLADSSKFGRLGTIRTFGLADIDTLVTNAPLANDFRDAFQQSKVNVLHV